MTDIEVEINEETIEEMKKLFPLQISLEFLVKDFITRCACASSKSPIINELKKWKELYSD